MRAVPLRELAALLLSASHTFEGIGKDIKKEGIERAATK